jgi:hypothetical protein
MHFSSPPCISCPSNPSLVHPNRVWYGVQIIKTPHWAIFTSLLVLHSSKFLFSNTIGLCSSLIVRPSFTPTQNGRQNYSSATANTDSHTFLGSEVTRCKTNRTYKYISKSIHSIKLNNTLNPCVLYKTGMLYVLFTYTFTCMKAFKTIMNHF